MSVGILSRRAPHLAIYAIGPIAVPIGSAGVDVVCDQIDVDRSLGFLRHDAIAGTIVVDRAGIYLVTGRLDSSELPGIGLGLYAVGLAGASSPAAPYIDDGSTSACSLTWSNVLELGPGSALGSVIDLRAVNLDPANVVNLNVQPTILPGAAGMTATYLGGI